MWEMAVVVAVLLADAAAAAAAAAAGGGDWEQLPILAVGLTEGRKHHRTANRAGARGAARALFSPAARHLSVLDSLLEGVEVAAVAGDLWHGGAALSADS